MKRLAYQIYLTIILCLVAVVVTAGVFWSRAGGGIDTRAAFEVVGELAAAALPDANAPNNVQAAALENYAQRLNINLAIYATDGTLIASTGKARQQLPARRVGFMFRRHGRAWATVLPDGRTLVATASRRGKHRPGLRLVAFLSAVALVVGLGAWPVVRGLTRRLEKLQTGVEQLGEGDLTSRVEIRGRDEVARLAASFNRSASRIEDLVSSHKMLLANASHELRTPLSRIRLGIDLLAQNPTPARRDAIAREINELDDLIEEILLLSRLDAQKHNERTEDVDLLALAAEEASHYPDCETSGTATILNGDPRLLRRMVRNLLDNAQKHGKPPIALSVTQSSSEIVLRVSDSGPGVPPERIATIFEPFDRAATTGAASGAGLGLALVRQIAARHGGTATVSKHAKTGAMATFEISLPPSGSGTDKR